MGKRLVNWFTFNVAFALVPLGALLALHALNATLTLETVADSPEVLFFSMIVSATALGDLQNMSTHPTKWDLVYRILWGVLMLGAVLSAILYGFLLYDTVVAPDLSAFRSNLLRVSLALAVVYGVLSTLVEALIGRASKGISEGGSIT